MSKELSDEEVRRLRDECKGHKAADKAFKKRIRAAKKKAEKVIKELPTKKQ